MREYREINKGDVIDTLEDLGPFLKKVKHSYGQKMYHDIRQRWGNFDPPKADVWMENADFDIRLTLYVKRKE